MARLFVAVDFSADIVSRLEQCQPPERPGIRLSSAEQLHLTLHFLGDVSPQRMAAALRMLRMEPLSLTIRGVGSFEGKDRTAILWAGIQENPSLLELHRKVAECLAVEGFQPETRPFSPHITVARCGPQVPNGVIQTFLTDHADLYLPDIPVDRVNLYSSTLTSRGPRYQSEQVVQLSSGRS